MNLKQVDAKVSVLQQIIDRYFLFDEDAEQMETGIYKGMLAGLGDRTRFITLRMSTAL